MHDGVVNIQQKAALLTETWQPRIIAEMNGHHFKVAKICGDFVWHSHTETDEVFVVLRGSMTMHLRGRDVPLDEGDMYVVPRGVEHKPSAHEECRLLLVEAAGTVNTGDAGGALTAPADAWI